MSIHFAIPATSYVLKAILEARLKKAYGTLAPPTVSIAPPPRPPAAPSGGGGGQAEAAALHLYLHHAGPNAAWSNMYDPRVSPEGARQAAAPLVLDLHYMLAARGADLEREALLGIGLAAFHRNGILPRPMIKSILDSVTVPPNSSNFMDGMYAEPLDEEASQPQEITISQQAVDIDTSTKVWSALQSPLRPCAFFLATTVFLQPDETFPSVKDVDQVDIALRPEPDPDADPSDDDKLSVTGGGP